MRKKVDNFMQVFWLSIAIVALIMAFYMIFRKGWGNAWSYLLFPVLAGSMFGLRRMAGKRKGKG